VFSEIGDGPFQKVHYQTLCLQIGNIISDPAFDWLQSNKIKLIKILQRYMFQNAMNENLLYSGV
jgi:hypothetical protein